MSLTTALFDHLAADAGLQALGITAERITPVVLPQNATGRRITFAAEVGEDIDSYDGPSSLTLADVQIDAWADKLVDAQTLAGAVKAAVNNFNGLMGTEQLRVHKVARGAHVDVFEEAVERYRSTGVYKIWHVEE